MKLTTARLKKLIREELSRLNETKEAFSGAGMSMSDLEAKVKKMGEEDPKLSIVKVSNVSQKTYEEYDEKANVDKMSPKKQDDGTYHFEYVM